jgi:hypothetical protein
VLEDGVIVGRIYLTPPGAAVDVGIERQEDRPPAHGYEATREAAMAAFAKCWRPESAAAGALNLPCRLSSIVNGHQDIRDVRNFP